MHRIIEGVWTTCKWPEDWTRSDYVTIPKSGDLLECSNHRTIAPICHASKILLNILKARMNNKISQELSDVQAGGRSGRGTGDQVNNVAMIKDVDGTGRDGLPETHRPPHHPTV